MSIQIQKASIEAMKQAMQMQRAMRAKAEEMIEMMRLVKIDARKRAFQYHRMIKAGEAGNFKEVKQLFTEMKSWKKYKIT